MLWTIIQKVESIKYKSNVARVYEFAQFIKV